MKAAFAEPVSSPARFCVATVKLTTNKLYGGRQMNMTSAQNIGTNVTKYQSAIAGAVHFASARVDRSEGDRALLFLSYLSGRLGAFGDLATSQLLDTLWKHPVQAEADPPQAHSQLETATEAAP